MGLIDKNFKVSEIGIFPKDWELKQIFKLGEVRGRVGWKGYTKKDLVASGAYAIGAKHINKSNKLDLSDPTFISDEKYYESPEIMVSKDDILIVQRGTIGKLVHIDKQIGAATINPSMVIVRLKKANPSYVYYYLVSERGQSQILYDTSSTGVPMITQKQIENFFIPLPPFHEQSTIATALCDIDALIENLEKFIVKKQNIKKGMMQELLRPKEDWVEKVLFDTAILKARIGWQGLTTAEYKTSGDFYLITGTEFTNGYIDWDNCFYVDASRYQQDKNIQVKLHDVLVTKDGTIGKVALIKSVPKPATLNSGVFVIRPINNSFHPEFFYYMLLSEIFTKFLSQLSAGSTINHLYQKDFVTFRYLTPKTYEEQERIAKVLYDTDSEIIAIGKRLAKNKMIKQGMMQTLLTGKIRLI